jgi:hypothetical protein
MTSQCRFTPKYGEWLRRNTCRKSDTSQDIRDRPLEKTISNKVALHLPADEQREDDNLTEERNHYKGFTANPKTLDKVPKTPRLADPNLDNGRASLVCVLEA